MDPRVRMTIGCGLSHKNTEVTDKCNILLDLITLTIFSEEYR